MRWLPWQDIVMFIGLPLVYTVLVVVVLCTPQDVGTGGYVVLFSTAGAFWISSVAVMVQRYTAIPDIVLANGGRVWTNGIPDITGPAVVQWLEFFCRHFDPALIDLDREGANKVLDAMCSAIRIEFTKGPRWRAAGMQSGTGMFVWWRGSVEKTAFFHELLHMVRQRTGRYRDYKHEAKEWWALEKKMLTLWRSTHGSGDG